MMDFSKFSCFLSNITIFNKFNHFIGVWGEAPADSGNCFTFYINIYAFGALLA